MKMMIRLIVALFGLAFIGGGLAFAFVPLRIATDFAVTTTAVAGLGTLRADLGGLFLGVGCFMLAGLRAGKAFWLNVPLVVLGIVLVLRALHLGMDGVTPEGMRSLVAEIVLVAVLFVARRVLSRDGVR